MKKSLLLTVILIGIALLSHAQVQRLVLAEEFTNDDCGPCASQNPAFDALLQANPGKITSIKYHVNWPGADPMNVHASSDVGTRVSYYAVTGVPYCSLDGAPTTGSSYSGAPANLSQTMIDTRYATPSPFEMSLQQVLSPNQDSAYITLMIHATQAVSGLMVAQTAEIEKQVTFSSPPGTNGESTFYNVVVKMFPSAGGLGMPSSWSTGDYSIIQYAWKLPTTIYNKAQLASVAFIQNNSTKAVLQAANSSANAIVPVYSNDANILSISEVPQSVCTNSISPSITIRNNGSQPLTSLLIRYHVNNDVVNTYQWNGHLTFLNTNTINLPAVNFTLNASNTLYVTTRNPNGTADQYTKNDSIAYAFIQAPTSVNKIHLDLKTDNAPQETTWDIKTSAGQVIASGGPYTQANTAFAYDLVMPSLNCYLFTIYDAGGNGIDNGNGHGYYNLYDSTGNTLGQGTSFGSKMVHSFQVTYVGIEELSNTKDIRVFPNPFKTSFDLDFNLQRAVNTEVEIFNSLGERVFSQWYMSMSPGENHISINGENLAGGIYFLKLKFGDEIKNIKITK